MKQPNFAAMSPAVAKAIEQMMAEQGGKFSLEKINLAELERVPSRVMRKFVCRFWLNEVSQQ